jgi:hypothetical protein
MYKIISTSARRILALTLVVYFVLPMLPGVTFSGDFGTALGFSVALFAAALSDLLEVWLILWLISRISFGKFSFDFKMETRSPFAPVFICALALAELPTSAHKLGVLTFDGWLPMDTSALILALTAFAVSLKFDILLFNLNIEQQGAHPRGGKKIRVTAALQSK